jgi:hypothetical protein
MPSLIDEFYQLVVTDLSPSELLDWNCMVDDVEIISSIQRSNRHDAQDDRGI